MKLKLALMLSIPAQSNANDQDHRDYLDYKDLGFDQSEDDRRALSATPDRDHSTSQALGYIHPVMHDRDMNDTTHLIPFTEDADRPTLEHLVTRFSNAANKIADRPTLERLVCMAERMAAEDGNMSPGFNEDHKLDLKGDLIVAVAGLDDVNLPEACRMIAGLMQDDPGGVDGDIFPASNEMPVSVEDSIESRTNDGIPVAV